MLIDGSPRPLVCKCFHRGGGGWGSKRSQSSTMYGICVQIADSLQNQCASNEVGVVGWWRASSGKCSLVWAAMMVVPNCRCALPTLPSLYSLISSTPPSAAHLFLLGLLSSPSGRPELLSAPLISAHVSVCVCVEIPVAHLQGCFFFPTWMSQMFDKWGPTSTINGLSNCLLADQVKIFSGKRNSSFLLRSCYV